MKGEVLVMRDGQLVPKRLARPLFRSDDARVYVISDTMNPVKHMGTGKIHDSKSQFRADTRATGCTEVGNDPAIMREKPKYQPPMREIAMDVKRSIEQLRSR